VEATPLTCLCKHMYMQMLTCIYIWIYLCTINNLWNCLEASARASWGGTFGIFIYTHMLTCIFICICVYTHQQLPLELSHSHACARTGGHLWYVGWWARLHCWGSAAHCNTRQHTATHCYTLQHAATHCNTSQRARLHCWGSAEHCNTLQHTATRFNTLQLTAQSMASLPR